MEDKYILAIRFRENDGIFFYYHYVLDSKYVPEIDFHNFDCLKHIPEVVLTSETFRKVNAISIFAIYNGCEV